jgi:hypothetical protein
MRSDTKKDEESVSRVREALDHIEDVVVDGLKHGFFQYTIKSEVVKDKKRILVVEAGKSEKFTIREDELPR